jgi:hypothetical protein
MAGEGSVECCEWLWAWFVAGNVGGQQAENGGRLDSVFKACDVYDTTANLSITSVTAL